MRAVLLFVLAVLVSAPLAAETIRLRAGEHSGYTRLVLDDAAGFDWTIGRTETGYALRPEGVVAEYIIDRARRDLRAGRVTDLRAQDGVLYLDLGCTCVLKSYTLSGGRFVLDLAKGTPDPELASEQPFVEAPVMAEAEAEVPPDPQPADPPPETVEPDADRAGKWLTAEPVATPTGDLPDFVTSVLGGPLGAAPSAPSEDSALANAPDYLEFEAMLSETLARAAAEGFVNAPNGSSVAGIDALAAEVAGAEGRTAYDIAKGDPPAETSTDICKAVDALSFLNDAAAYEEQTVGPLLHDAYDDDGVLNPEAALDLARFLMWKGYGAEAAQLFDLAGAKGDEGMLLSMAALAMDGKAATGDVPLDAFARCGGTGGLWSLLAGADTEVTNRIDIPAAIRVYSAYPAHLRRLIGPLLATHLITHGHVDEARLVANVIPLEAESDPKPDGEHSEESPDAAGVPDHEASLTDLSLEVAGGEDVSAALGEHIAKAGPETHEAVLLQSQSKAAAGIEPDAAEIETLRALQADAGEGELRNDLFATELRRLLDASDFTGVIGRTAEARPEDLTPEVKDLESDAWSGLIALGSNLDVALAMRRWPDGAARADLAPGIRERLTERLKEIGPVSAEVVEAETEASAVTEDAVAETGALAGIADDPKPVAAAKSALEALKAERADLEAILNGTKAESP